MGGVGGVAIVGAVGVAVVVLAVRLRRATRRRKSGEIELATVGFSDLKDERYLI